MFQKDIIDKALTLHYLHLNTRDFALHVFPPTKLPLTLKVIAISLGDKTLAKEKLSQKNWLGPQAGGRLNKSFNRFSQDVKNRNIY